MSTRELFDIEDDDQSMFDFDSSLHIDDEPDLRSKMSKDFSSDIEEEYMQDTEKGALYDAYNLLHTLAQVSHKN